MKTIQFNEQAYTLAPNGDWVSGETFYCTIIKGENSVEDISSAVADCDDIVVTETENEEVISIKHYEGFTEFEAAALYKDWIIGNDKTADVVEVRLHGKSDIQKLTEAEEKNRADIDYLSMMSGIEIPTEV